MTDTELLEAAAKAAGVELEGVVEEGTDAGKGVTRCGDWWAPLHDDGDALRLVVDLQMDVYVRAEWVEAVAPMGAPQKVRYGLEGPRVAARRAITCAAAAMPARRVLGAA